MKNTKDISSIKSLDEEILRLQLENERQKKELKEQWSEFSQNAPRIISRTLLCGPNDTSEKDEHKGGFMGKFSAFFEKTKGRFADRMAETLNGVIDRMFEKYH